MSDNYSILLLGLDPQAEAFARRHFAELQYSVSIAPSVAEGEEMLANPEHEIVFIKTEPNDGATAALRRLQSVRPGLPVILISVDSTPSNAIDAFRAGAVDVLILPLTAQALDDSIARAAKKLPNRSREPAEARLHYLDETGKEQWVPLRAPRSTIGRNSTNNLVFPQMNISRSQVELAVKDGVYTVRDLGSKHGTYLNGTRVDHAVLTHGDRLQLGGLQGQTVTFYQGDLLQSLLASSDSKPPVSGNLA